MVEWLFKNLDRPITTLQYIGEWTPFLSHKQDLQLWPDSAQFDYRSVVTLAAHCDVKNDYRRWTARLSKIGYCLFNRSETKGTAAFGG
jgi:hypothetical protein